MRVAIFPVLAITVSACADPHQVLVPEGRAVPDHILAAKPVPNPRATFEYITVLPSASGGRLIGDERDADGNAAAGSSIYDDGKCGVTAQIFVGGSGDATMDPIGTNPSCGEARSLKVEFGDAIAGAEFSEPAIGGHFTNVRDVHSLAAAVEPASTGGSGERRFRLTLRGFTGCDYLRYENPDGSDGRPDTADDVSYDGITGRSIRVTRLADVDGKRVWEAVSQTNGLGEHVAFCEKVSKRGSTYLGVYDSPFRIVVREK